MSKFTPIIHLAVSSECQSNPDCSLPPENGPCDGVCPRWYYDNNTKTCRQFQYGCCGGNGNNFLTEKECYAACAGIV